MEANEAKIAFLDGIHPEVTGKPKVTLVGVVAPDIPCLRIRSQSVRHGRQIPYDRIENDRIVLTGSRKNYRLIEREGKKIGALAGPDRDILFTPDQLVGEKLDTDWADLTTSYRIVSKTDERFSAGVAPTTVYRKSKPIDATRTPTPPASGIAHWLYLKLPKPLAEGHRYRVEFQGSELSEPQQVFLFDSTISRSEAVHVSQVGFRPDDPAKMATLSCWMGSGRGLDYSSEMTFHVLDNQSREPVFTGKTVLIKAKETPEHDGKNHVQADVYRLDFTELTKPGNYCLSVEGVGCSFPFQIAEDAWQKAFYVSARGFYHQRNGIELKPPFTDFYRPRSFHPKDGVKVFASTYSHNVHPKKFGGIFNAILQGKTDELLPNAWGGYMDAGDWDRRPAHIEIPRMLLDLYEMAPAYFERLSLNIPESDDDLPDLLNEALWGLDLFRRLQTPEGGIRSGIESEAHPRIGECSWQESLTIMAFGPNPGASYHYAGVAAHAAHLLRDRKPELAAEYLRTANLALAWAESQSLYSGPRCLAAAELFRATGEERWHQLFLETTTYKQSENKLNPNPKQNQHDEAAWVYLQTDRPGRDAQILKRIRETLLADADLLVAACEQTAFGNAMRKGQPIRWGAYSSPRIVSLIRSHFLTGEEKYLRAAVLACQSGAGANPLNLCYTTGVGQRFPQHVLHEDARVSNQPAPPGLTVGGPRDPARHFDRWAKRFVGDCYPDMRSWPSAEAYWDVFMYAPMCEYTVHQTMLPVTYAWGYLAARP